VAVAQERHFGRAADRLHIGQPAVSQQIRRLERELGADLLDRSPRHVTLTAAGERFLPEAKALLAAAQRARAAVTNESTTVRIGTSTGLGANLDRVLDRLATLAPSLTVELVAVPTDVRLDRVTRGELDAAFVRAAPRTADLRLVPVWRDHLLAVLPARHPLADHEEVSLAALAALPLRLTPRRNNPALVDLVVNSCHAMGVEPTPGPISTNLQDTLAAIGVGAPSWTVVYAAHAALLQTSRVVFRPFQAPGLALTTSLVFNRKTPSPQAELLVRACASDDHES